MCSRTTCRTCGNATYRGCGNHVEQVLAGVPSDQLCRCRETKAAARAASSSPARKSRTRQWFGARRSGN